MIRTARTENGLVEGLPAADPRITAFKGIPFAAPPVGANRWRAPQPCENWEGIKKAYQFAPISVQDTPGLGEDVYCREWHVDSEVPMDEDCLYLNVWTNAKSQEDNLPVMVWFFGGAFQWGYPSEMEFDGERIARRDVIFVSVNYRVNVFGFLAHPELTQQQSEAPANFGNLDQQAGLKWVKRNIRAFGGDPDNITIAGQSAGGASVMSQLTNPDNEGLFQKAVIMSGMIRSPYEELPLIMADKLEDAQKLGEEFLTFIGAETIEQAREMDARYISERYAAFASGHPRMGMVIDHRFSFGEPLVQIRHNQYVHVPLMTGNTTDEFLSCIEAASEEALSQRAKELFGDKAEEFLTFPQTHEKRSATEYAQANGISCTVRDVLLEIEKAGNAQNYYYSFDADIPGEDHPGTFHSVDLWFFFETLAKSWRPFQGRHYDLARQMCNYLTNFIKNGDPNGCDNDGTAMPRWDTYTASHRCRMQFRTDGVYADDTQESAYEHFLMERIAEQVEQEH